MVSSPPSSELVEPGSVKVHGDRGVIELSGGVGRGPRPLLRATLFFPVVISVGPIVEGTGSIVVLEWVQGDAIPPSDDVVDCLPRPDCFYRSLF